MTFEQLWLGARANPADVTPTGIFGAHIHVSPRMCCNDLTAPTSQNSFELLLYHMQKISHAEHQSTCYINIFPSKCLSCVMLALTLAVIQSTTVAKTSLQRASSPVHHHLCECVLLKKESHQSACFAICPLITI